MVQRFFGFLFFKVKEYRDGKTRENNDKMLETRKQLRKLNLKPVLVHLRTSLMYTSESPKGSIVGGTRHSGDKGERDENKDWFTSI